MAKKDKSGQAPLPADLNRIAESAREMFAFERDVLLDGDIPDSALPQDEDALFDRDPFSADFVAYRIGQSQRRKEKYKALNEQLRDDLLEHPHLLEKPAESGTRGAAAVWRSLRDLLRGETEGIIDGSSVEELKMLKRELETRKAIVEAVNTGLQHQLKRLEQRLSAHDKRDTEISPAQVTIKKR